MAHLVVNNTAERPRFVATSRFRATRILLPLISILAILGSGCSADTDDLTGASQTDEPASASTDIAASGSSGGSRSGPVAVEVREAGVEPRIELAMAVPSEATVQIAAQSIDSGQVGSEPFERVRSLSYDLAVTTEVEGEVHRVALAPRVTAIEPAIPIEIDDRIDDWNWTIAPNGVVISTETPVLTDPRLRELSSLLSAPELFAAVPTTPVGVGARWSYSSTTADGAMVEAELLSVDDTTVVISYELLVELGEGTVDVSWNGSYDRTTLMATNVSSSSVFEFSSETTTNGVPVPVLGRYQVERSIVKGNQ